MEYNGLKKGELSENGQVEIFDQDRLCYKVISRSKGAYGIRTISKNLLDEFYKLYIERPDITANEARELLCGQSDIDKFEYGYASTLWQMAKMLNANRKNIQSNSSHNEPNSDKSIPRQIIFYGAPGTGKSHKIKEILGEYEGCPKDKKVPKENIFRTTFHPDSDYSTFVGAYKPTRGKKPLYGLNGGLTVRLNDGNNDLEEDIITYKFIPQAFLNAYIRAYQTDGNVYLIIEEINRGNCAQIFGDLFQLLDRDRTGKSEYTIKADADLRAFLEDKLGYDNLGIKDGELCLPSNLYIYATMNTSDQSLFPIDSAFKRRWDWEYEPIKYKNTDWVIDIDGLKYRWSDFQKEVNTRILKDTGSEDKMLGDYFVNPPATVISYDLFRNKILFYLWNDVCKDGDADIFPTDDDFSFSKLYDEDSKQLIVSMMDKLNLKPVDVDDTENSEDDIFESNDNDDNENNSNRIKQPKYSINGSLERYSTPATVKRIIEDYANKHGDISTDDMIQLWNDISERNNCLVASWTPSPNDNQPFANKRRVEIKWNNKSVWLLTGWTEELFQTFIHNVKNRLGIVIEKVE